MPRIGKDVTFDGNKENIQSLFIKWLPTRPEAGVQDPPNITFLSNVQLRIYGWDTDLTDLKQTANNKGFIFNIDGDAPAEPVPEVETPPTQDEIDAYGFFKQAFNDEMESMENAILANIETRYNTLKGANPIPFSDVGKTDIKHLRQRLN